MLRGKAIEVPLLLVGTNAISWPVLQLTSSSLLL